MLYLFIYLFVYPSSSTLVTTEIPRNFIAMPKHLHSGDIRCSLMFSTECESLFL